VNVFIEFSTDHSLRCSVGSKGFRLAAAEKIHTVQSSMTMVQIQKFMLPIAELMTKVMLISLSLSWQRTCCWPVVLTISFSSGRRVLRPLRGVLHSQRAVNRKRQGGIERRPLVGRTMCNKRCFMSITFVEGPAEERFLRAERTSCIAAKED
jgi:hypothetical protein